ncbi:MAG TPA: helix-hairpin-helix domain-containing protein [Ferruginibacter sp.]|nr:helix-hairpin-helix domain-containing protein [Ferruginibacter sp.]HRQ21418.1 helix-hairpin-helix domain-containing protein [Ferruginibacter sp.]
MMDNALIADTLSLLGKLMDIHGENSFKTKTYHAAAFTIERFPTPLSTLSETEIASIKGIGKSSAEKITELIQTGKLKILEEIIRQTPPGIIEMMHIKGIGPKKINTIWKEMGIETVGELLYACKENHVKLYKGFGEKTQQSIIESIEYFNQQKGKYLFAQTEETETLIRIYLEKTFGENNVKVTGAFAQQNEIIEALSYLVAAPVEKIKASLNATGYEPVFETKDQITYLSKTGLKVMIYPVAVEEIPIKNLELTSSAAFFHQVSEKLNNRSGFSNEDELFKAAGIPFIPEFLRENPGNITKYTHGMQLVTEDTIHGIIHTHTTWSDGAHTIEEMAKACIVNGKSYLVISDHSKSAFYANGLNEDRITDQHREINRLNNELAPFRIYKSIECDILNDGRLDYSDDVLSTFDLVIASIHSQLKMQEDKAMHRLIQAIENPYTTILGHLTGRLLLSRNGYPINHRKIIDACVANRVVIELNANPHRLDIDWREIDYALEKGALISINPDAHSIEGMDDIRYGVLVAQKAMLTPQQNLSSFTVDAFEEFIAQKHPR